MKYHIWTIGCQMNEADSRYLGSQLESLGYEAIDEPADADIVVLNTCVVRQQAEDRASGKLQYIKKYKDRNPNMTLALMGCMVGMREAPRLKERFPFVDVFMPPSETEPLLDYLGSHGLYDESRLHETRATAIRHAIQDGDYILPALQKGNSVTAHVPIVLGCSHACTFCVIPYRRGAERSRPHEDILKEIHSLVEQGIKEVTLIGQIVDRYGMDTADGGTSFDNSYDLASLLTDTANVDGLHRVRFLTSHPNWMNDRIIDAVASHKKICPQFEIPAQAGNNEVLENMRRGYTIEEYESVVEKIRSRIPDAAIHTDIIVGFPSETDEQFMDTYNHIERIGPDKIHLAKYSERPKTIAARQFPDNVTADEKERRRKMIETLQTRITEKKMKQFDGQTVRVLVEGLDKKSGRWRGRTEQCKLVYFEDPRDLKGELVDVKVHWTGPWSLLGRAVDCEAVAGCR